MVSLIPTTPLRGASSAPHWTKTLQEFRLPLDLLRAMPHWPRVMTGLDGGGRTVMLLPGLMAKPGTMAAVRIVLAAHGFQVRDWGLGRNAGNPEHMLERAKLRVETASRAAGDRIDLVGWSLGGLMAREVARDRPDLVRHVVTLGSPVIGGPRLTTLGGIYKLLGKDVHALEAAMAERYRRPLTVPVTAFVSRRDGIVPLAAAIDHWSGTVEHVEVEATHLGMGFDPVVLRGIVHRLAPMRCRPH